MIKRTLGHLTKAQPPILRGVKTNRQATNFQLLFKFCPKGFLNLKSSFFFIFRVRTMSYLVHRKVFYERI